MPSALRNAGKSIECYHEHFSPGTEDPVWIPDVSRRGWLILTTDARFRYKPNERRALLDAKAAVVIFTGAEMTASAQAQVILAARGAIERLYADSKRPFVATLTKSGDLGIRWPVPERPPRGKRARRASK